MPDRTVVINTTPLIALSAAGCFDALSLLYQHVIVPLEVAGEIRAGGGYGIGVAELNNAPSWLEIQASHAAIPPYLANALDRGEAAVITTALDRNIQLVCIDETVGRRMARLSGLDLTGSLGILIQAKQRGFPAVIADAVQRMRDHGIWLSAQVIASALAAAGER
jgi:predicted nucleic acid-binding protein